LNLLVAARGRRSSESTTPGTGQGLQGQAPVGCRQGFPERGLKPSRSRLHASKPELGRGPIRMYAGDPPWVHRSADLEARWNAQCHICTPETDPAADSLSISATSPNAGCTAALSATSPNAGCTAALSATSSSAGCTAVPATPGGSASSAGSAARTSTRDKHRPPDLIDTSADRWTPLHPALSIGLLMLRRFRRSRSRRRGCRLKHRDLD
jgi:hypothetical protein